ncbi:MAG: amidohydrolase family protein [Candidatus Helarchaeota archaeon]|nr:amidohydrolase family protein [Candidatus Helarchaeota archaeon]
MRYREIKGIHSVTIINPESGEAIEDCDIQIEKGIIFSIKLSKGTPPEDYLNGTGLYAIPGLIDTHVHSLGFVNEDLPSIFDLRWIFRQQRNNLAYYLRSGVTTIRDMGSATKLIRSYSRRAARFKIQSPRIIYAGPMFTVKGGYPHYVPRVPFYIRWFAGLIRIDCKNEKHAQEMVDKVVAAGARIIKVMYQSEEYDDERTKIPIISLSIIRAIVERAHFHNIPVGIHHTYRKDLQELLKTDIPFDSLEHLTTDEHLSDGEIKNLVQRGVSNSTTFTAYSFVYHGDELEALIQQEPKRFEKKSIQFLQKMCQAIRSGGEPLRIMSRNYLNSAPKFMRANLKKSLDAGVKIVYATDSGISVPSGIPHWELKDMVQAGMTNLDALKAATCVAADVIDMPELGRLEPNKIADIVLLRGNPLEKIETVKDVAAVIRDGYLVHDEIKVP